MNNLAWIWAEKNINLDKAEKMIKSVIQKDKNKWKIWDTYGYVLLRKKNYKEALSGFMKANKLSPKNKIVNEHIGDVYYALGKK